MSRSSDFKSASNDIFTSKEKDILEKSRKFFSTNRKYIDAMLDIIAGNSNISIRVLDWFVANYSKKNNTVYKTRVNGEDNYFNVNIEYKNQLNGYSKQYFDPFCRKKKVKYSYKNKGNKNEKPIVFVSSIGQLNFFQWAIRNKVIRYVESHIAEIEKDMKETSKLNKEKKQSTMITSESESEDDLVRNDEPDPMICSSEKINSIFISPAKKATTKSSSDKRRKLSKSVYEHGIKKSNVSIKLDF